MEEFKKYWLKNYMSQYKTSTKEEKKEIKSNLYKNNNLTQKEKDKIWEVITR